MNIANVNWREKKSDILNDVSSKNPIEFIAKEFDDEFDFCTFFWFYFCNLGKYLDRNNKNDLNKNG